MKLDGVKFYDSDEFEYNIHVYEGTYLMSLLC